MMARALAPAFFTAIGLVLFPFGEASANPAAEGGRDTGPATRQGDALSDVILELVEAEYPVLVSGDFRRALARCLAEGYAGLDDADRDMLAATRLDPPAPHNTRILSMLPDIEDEQRVCRETIRPEDFPYDPAVRGIDPEPPVLMPIPAPEPG